MAARSLFNRIRLRHRLLSFLLLAIALLPALAPALQAQRRTPPQRKPVLLFSEGYRIGPVYYPAHAKEDDIERKAALVLAHYLEKISGQKWQALPESGRLDAPGIYVGKTRQAFVSGFWRVQLPETPLRLPTDRIDFDIRAQRVVLTGENPRATLSGVYRFLQHYTGAQWYAPGPMGEEIPELPALSLPPRRSHWQPSFRDRQFYLGGNTSPASRTWLEQVGASRHFSFNHNLHRIFTPELHASHPEYWAKVSGVRRAPTPGRGGATRQLDYTHPDLPAIVAQAAARAFAANPDRQTFSLGINDTIDFGNDEATHAAISPQRYLHGHPVFSNLIFAFTNETARLVGKTNPRHRLTTLAYMWAESPPDFALEPNLIPYLCVDHSQWYNAQRMRTDKAIAERWAHSGAKEFGSWEYYQGGGFFIPRIFNRVAAESLKFLHESGYRSIFFEGSSNLGFDAAKMWLASQLAWDIDADADALLTQFYKGYYGAAAEPMQELFEFFEHIWMTQKGHPFWLKYFYTPTQAELYPPAALRRMNELLARAQAALDAADAPERYRQRLKQTLAYAKYLSAAAAFYDCYRKLATLPLADAVDVTPFLQTLADFSRCRTELTTAFEHLAAQPHTKWFVDRGMQEQLLMLQPQARLAAAFQSGAIQPEALAAAWEKNASGAAASTTANEIAATDASPATVVDSATGSAAENGTGSAAVSVVANGVGSTAVAGEAAVAASVLPASASTTPPLITIPPAAKLLFRADFSQSVLDGDTEGFGPLAPHPEQFRNDWNTSWTHHEGALLQRIPDSDGGEAWVLKIRNQEFLSVYRWLKIPDDAKGATARLEVRGHHGEGTRFHLNAAWLDEDGKQTGKARYNLLPSGTYTQWQDVAVSTARPEGAQWVYMGFNLQFQAPHEPLQLRNWEVFSW